MKQALSQFISVCLMVTLAYEDFKNRCEHMLVTVILLNVSDAFFEEKWWQFQKPPTLVRLWVFFSLLYIGQCVHWYRRNVFHFSYVYFTVISYGKLSYVFLGKWMAAAHKTWCTCNFTGVREIFYFFRTCVVQTTWNWQCPHGKWMVAAKTRFNGILDVIMFGFLRRMGTLIRTN